MVKNEDHEGKKRLFQIFMTSVSVRADTISAFIFILSFEEKMLWKGCVPDRFYSFYLL